MEFVNLKLGNLHKSAETAAAEAVQATEAAAAGAGAAASTTLLWRSS